MALSVVGTPREKKATRGRGDTREKKDEEGSETQGSTRGRDGKGEKGRGLPRGGPGRGRGEGRRTDRDDARKRAQCEILVPKGDNKGSLQRLSPRVPGT